MSKNYSERLTIDKVADCVGEDIVQARHEKCREDGNEDDEAHVGNSLLWLRPHDVVELCANVPEVGEE